MNNAPYKKNTTAGNADKSLPAVSFKSLFQFSKPKIDAAFKNAKRIAGTKELTLLQAPSEHNHGKLLIIIPKKVGKAHDRNLLRRRLKAIFYENKLYQKIYTFIILARPGAAQIQVEQLKQFVINSLQNS